MVTLTNYDWEGDTHWLWRLWPPSHRKTNLVPANIGFTSGRVGTWNKISCQARERTMVKEVVWRLVVKCGAVWEVWAGDNATMILLSMLLLLETNNVDNDYGRKLVCVVSLWCRDCGGEMTDWCLQPTSHTLMPWKCVVPSQARFQIHTFCQ